MQPTAYYIQIAWHGIFPILSHYKNPGKYIQSPLNTSNFNCPYKQIVLYFALIMAYYKRNSLFSVKWFIRT